MAGLLLLPGGWHELAGQPSNSTALPAYREFAVESWLADRGLPQNSASAVIQTRRGYIWVGTFNGIAEFDGRNFKVFDASQLHGLANSRVTSLWEAPAGPVWIGHDTGEVSYHSNGVFAATVQPPEWRRNPIKEFLADRTGAVWALNQLGEALRIRDGRVEQLSGPMAASPFANPRVTTDAQGRALVLRNGLVAELTPSGYEPVRFDDPMERPFYLALAASRDGQLWVLGEGRLRKWNGAAWSADLGNFPGTGVAVTGMLELASGRIVVGTQESGLIIFDPATGWATLTRAHGLPQDWVLSLAEDQEHNLWVGTGGGLAVLRERKVTMLGPPDDWLGRTVLSITQTRDGQVWAATEGAGVYRFSNGEWARFEPENQFVWSVLADSQNHIWAGTWGGGLFHLETDRFVAQTNMIPEANPITALTESPADTLWIGTGTGLFRWQDNTLTSFADQGGAAAGDVRAIEVGGSPGEIWIGTQGAGLGHFRDNEFRTYQDQAGLADNFILSLKAETNGALWIGTLDHGLCRFQSGQFRTLTTAHGLPANIIYHIADDHLGFFWFNSPVGLFRVSKQQLHACADGQLARLDVLTYGKTEGLATLAGTGGFTPSGFRAPDGRLWFSNSRGIAVVDPQRARPNPVAPPVWIEKILVNGESILPQRPQTGRPTAVLPPGRSQLEIEFTGINFTAPERVHFRFRLDGVDSGWKEADATARRVTYNFLPPGHYKFQVIARNSDGAWNDTGDTLAIRVQPHLWQTAAFKVTLSIAGSAAVGVAVFLLSRHRHRRKLERIAQERALERERARIAQDIHDDLGASLTRIGLLSETAAGELGPAPQAAARLEQIIVTTRELTRSMDEIVWAVNPRHDTLDSLTEYIGRLAQDFLGAANIRCRLAMPMQLPDTLVRSEVRHNLFLACKETLHNVVKHAQATEVRLALELSGGGLKLTISDNGPGFDPQEAPRPGGRQRAAAGNGLLNLEARLRLIGGKMTLASAPGQGTHVEFFVPLPAANAPNQT
jgi:signal transduction histidine kinase/ligand-binding sensor domain-containing protein